MSDTDAPRVQFRRFTFNHEGLKECAFCGGRFRPKRKTRRYCSASCRQGAYAGRTPPVVHACAQCGEHMFDKRSDAVFCSRRCASAWRRRIERVAVEHYTEEFGEDRFRDFATHLRVTLGVTPGGVFAARVVKELDPDLDAQLEAGTVGLWAAFRAALDEIDDFDGVSGPSDDE